MHNLYFIITRSITALLNGVPTLYLHYYSRSAWSTYYSHYLHYNTQHTRRIISISTYNAHTSIFTLHNTAMSFTILHYIYRPPLQHSTRLVCSFLHAKTIFHHYYLQYFLRTWPSYSTFTLSLPLFWLDYLLYTPSPIYRTYSPHYLYSTRTTHTSSSLCNYSFAEWTSYNTFILSITFVLHGRPTFHVISILHTQPTLRIIHSYTWIAYTSIFTLLIAAMSYKYPTLHYRSP